MRSNPCVRVGVGAVFAFVRLMERMLSPSSLRGFLMPFIAIRVAFRRRQPSQPVPKFLGGGFRITKRQQRNASLNTYLEFFPEQLGTPKWRDHLQFDGIQYLETARRQKRPVILAFCHFGPYSLLRYWLRAAGIPAATLVKGESKERTLIRRLKDRLAPFPDVPTAFHRDDELRAAVEFLAAGNVLLTAIDIMNGKRVDISVDEHWNFWMATGPLRMAMRQNAEIIPCTIIDRGNWHFQIFLGSPVPASSIVSGDATLVGQHLLDAMLPIWREHPEHCTKEFMKKFHRADSGEISDQKKSTAGSQNCIKSGDMKVAHGAAKFSLSPRERLGVRGKDA